MKGIDRPSYEALEGQFIENALMPDYNLELMSHYQTTAMSDEKQALVDRILAILEEAMTLEEANTSDEWPKQLIEQLEVLAAESKAIAEGLGHNLALALFAHGFTARVLERYQEASSALLKANALNPKSYEILTQLIISLGMQARHEQALRYAQELHSMDPHSLTTISTLALCFKNAGETDEAVILIKQALEQEPNNPYVKALYDQILSPTVH